MSIDYKTRANELEARLKELDAEAREGIDDACWLYERTEKVALDAIEVIRLQARPVPSNPNPDHRPDHDSLFSRFEQLEAMLERATASVPVDVRWMPAEALQIVRLIRGQVLK